MSHFKSEITNNLIIISLFIFTLVFAFSIVGFNPTKIVNAGQDNANKTWICHLNNSNIYGSCGYNLIQVDNDSIDGVGNNDHTLHTCQAFPSVTIKDIIPAVDSNNNGQLDENDCYCSIDSSLCSKPSSSSSVSASSSEASSSASNSVSSSSESSSSSSFSATSSVSVGSSSVSSVSTSSSLNSSSVSSSSKSTSSATVTDSAGVGGVQDYDPQAYVAPKKLIKTGSENLVMEVLNLLNLNK